TIALYPGTRCKHSSRHIHTTSVQVRAGFQRIPHTAASSLDCVWIARHRAPRPEPDRPAESLRKLELVLDQLERAELYLVAAINVGLSDPEQRRELEDLRAQLAATRRSLARPRVIDYTSRR